MVKNYCIEVLTDEGWKTIVTETENYLRFRVHKIVPQIRTKSLRLTVLNSWGESEPTRVYEIRVY